MGMDMNKLLGQMQQMQEEMAKAQEELATQVVEATAGGGMVTVVVSGGMELKSIKIDPACIDPKDPGMLQDLVIAAVNQGITKAQEMQANELKAVTGGMSIPGLF